MQVMHHLPSKNTIPSKHNISNLFRLNDTKMLIMPTFSVPLWKQSRLRFRQSKLLLFRPFLFSIICNAIWRM